VVSGSVTAGTLATAQAWAAKQRALLTGDALGGSYPRQEEWETDYEFVPRIDGIPTGNTVNVRLYRVNFTFGRFCRCTRSRRELNCKNMHWVSPNRKSSFIFLLSSQRTN